MAGRERGPERRRQIADAALEIIAKKGMAALTTAAIAEQVGVTDGALFRHFESKDAIVLAAIDRVAELVAEPPAEAGADPLVQLRGLFLHRARVVREHEGIARLVLSDELAFAVGTDGAERVRAIRQRTAAAIRRHLEDAREAGILPGDADVPALTTIVQGAMLATTVGAPSPGPSRTWAALEGLLVRGGGAGRRRRPPSRGSRGSR